MWKYTAALADTEDSTYQFTTEQSMHISIAFFNLAVKKILHPYSMWMTMTVTFQRFSIEYIHKHKLLKMAIFSVNNSIIYNLIRLVFFSGTKSVNGFKWMKNLK